MNVFRVFGVGGDKIRANNCSVPGTVTEVNRCWWLRINTKPLRRFSGDGAVYPSIITFSYQVDNVSYVGKLYIPYRYRAPQKGETIDISYDPENPKNYACYAFGPAFP